MHNMWLRRIVNDVPYYDSANVVRKLDRGWYEMEMVGMDSRLTRLGFLRGTRFYDHESEVVDEEEKGVHLVNRFIDQEFEMSVNDLPKNMTQLAQINIHGKHYAHVYREISSGLPVMRRQGKLTLWYPDTTWADLLPLLGEEDRLYVDFQEDLKKDVLSTEVLDYEILDIQVC